MKLCHLLLDQKVAPSAAADKGFTGWLHIPCLLYTSDAADERSSVDLGGRRIIKKKKQDNNKKQTWAPS